MTYHNAVKYIQSAPIKNGAAESLERIRLLCERLGSPERRLKYIRFAGSNGKTVCQTMLSSILTESGLRVGSLIMPASGEPESNVLVCGKQISMNDMLKYVSLIASTVTSLKSEIESADPESEIPESVLSGKISIAPTQNELIFLVALLAFRDAECNICLIECDHNGADPTKLLAPPFAAVICGTIPEENTKETHRIRSYLQSGISELVSAPQNGDTYKIISSACARINCRLSIPTKFDVVRLSLNSSEFVYRGERYTLGLCGRFQIHNATTVIETVRMLNRSGANISQDAIRRGLASVSIRAKFETISVLPTIIADSTHKTEAVATMCNTLRDFKEQTGNKLRLCIQHDIPLIATYVSVLHDLGYEILEIMIPTSDKHSVPPSLDVSCPITLYNTPKSAAKRIVAASREEGFILITAEAPLADKVRTEVLRILEF